MNRKAFGLLILVAAILIALAVVSQNGVNTRPIAGDSAGTQLLTGLSDELNGVSRISITGAGGQQLVGLERADDEWTVQEAGGYPAERSKVNALLISLAEAKIVEEKTSNPDLHSRLGVEAIENPEAAGVEVTLLLESGERFDVILGDTYTSNQVYARRADDDQSVLIDRNPDVARDPGDWVVADIINLDSDRVQRVEITQASGERLVIRKETPGAANFAVDEIPEGRELQYAGVANVTANLLQNLRLDDVQPADDELTGPMVISEFWTFDGLVVTVTTTGVGDDAWLALRARFDTDQALLYSDTPDSDDLVAADPVEEADSVEAPEESARAEAESLNRRLADWRYRIPSYQLSQLTRRSEDLLKPPASE